MKLFNHQKFKRSKFRLTDNLTYTENSDRNLQVLHKQQYIASQLQSFYYVDSNWLLKQAFYHVNLHFVHLPCQIVCHIMCLYAKSFFQFKCACKQHPLTKINTQNVYYIKNLYILQIKYYIYPIFCDKLDK